ncbi:MAG: hypothetical protein AB7P08_17325 [Burkholderiales bacterium]
MSHPGEMSAAATARVREVRATVHRELGPDGVAFIAGLARDGLIHGWRDVVWAGNHEEAAKRNALIASRSVTAGEFLSQEPVSREGHKWTR